MNIIRVDPVDIANGPGVRVVVWVAGCHHNCTGCHNPTTHDFNQGHDAINLEPLIMTLIKPDYIRGITFSGGDPFAPENIQYVSKLCNKIKSNYPQKDTWVYTGYTFEEIDIKYLKNVDVLVDGPFIQDKKDITLLFRGSSNQRLIDVKNSINSNKIILWKGND